MLSTHRNLAHTGVERPLQQKGYKIHLWNFDKTGAPCPRNRIRFSRLSPGAGERIEVRGLKLAYLIFLRKRGQGFLVLFQLLVLNLFSNSSGDWYCRAL